MSHRPKRIPSRPLDQLHAGWHGAEDVAQQIRDLPGGIGASPPVSRARDVEHGLVVCSRADLEDLIGGFTEIVDVVAHLVGLPHDFEDTLGE